jgi:hypothetical protein
VFGKVLAPSLRRRNARGGPVLNVSKTSIPCQPKNVSENGPLRRFAAARANGDSSRHAPPFHGCKPCRYAFPDGCVFFATVENTLSFSALVILSIAIKPGIIDDSSISYRETIVL